MIMWYTQASSDLAARLRGNYFYPTRQQRVRWAREALTSLTYDIRPFSPRSHVRCSYTGEFANSPSRVASINALESIWVRGFNPKLH